MSVAAALAEATHHSIPKGGWSVTHIAPRGPKTTSAWEEPTSSQLFGEEDVGGMRADRLNGGRPQDTDHQRTVEQIIDFLVLHIVEQLGDAVWEPILVLQMVEQLVGEEDETELHSQFATLRRVSGTKCGKRGSNAKLLMH